MKNVPQEVGRDGPPPNNTPNTQGPRPTPWLSCEAGNLLLLIITRLLRCWVKTSMGNMRYMPEIITIKTNKQKDYQPLVFNSLMKIQPQEARADHQVSSAEKEQALQLLPKEGPPRLGSTCHAHRAWASGVAGPLPSPVSSFLPFHHPARLYFLCDLLLSKRCHVDMSVSEGD